MLLRVLCPQTTATASSLTIFSTFFFKNIFLLIYPDFVWISSRFCPDFLKNSGFWGVRILRRPDFEASGFWGVRILRCPDFEASGFFVRILKPLDFVPLDFVISPSRTCARFTFFSGLGWISHIIEFVCEIACAKFFENGNGVLKMECMCQVVKQCAKCWKVCASIFEWSGNMKSWSSCAKNRMRVPKIECVCQPLKSVCQLSKSGWEYIWRVWKSEKLEFVCQRWNTCANK